MKKEYKVEWKTQVNDRRFIHKDCEWVEAESEEAAINYEKNRFLDINDEPTDFTHVELINGVIVFTAPDDPDMVGESFKVWGFRIKAMRIEYDDED